MTNGEKIQTILDVDRDCTEVHGKNGIMTFSVPQEWWNAEYKEPRSSEKPNKSIEEKCPCYYCEHFEIKGLSHCEIHEEAYGDSRCNDYHKINQKPNKSEISTGSITKNCESCRHYGLHHEICNYCYKCSLWKEKDEPKAVRYEGDGYADGSMVYDMAFCPNCEHEFEEDSENWGCDFCPNCGQRLRWEE